MGIRAKRKRANLAARFLLLMAGLACVLAAGVLIVARLSTAALSELGPGDSRLNPAERAALAAYLTARIGDLTGPTGTDATPVTFSVEAGETAAGVAGRLAEAGLVRDAQLLTYYMRYQGIDGEVEAGDFVLRQTMSTRQVARALTDAMAREFVFRVTEGWRREQIAAALAGQSALAATASDFLLLTGPNSPRGAKYAFLSDLGPGASLEGYLFPDTYLLQPDATAAGVVDKMLANFQARLPAGYHEAAAARGLSLHQAVTLASLIEREAVVADERPLIASVIHNRLAAGQPLEIDASVQYALGTADEWWPRLYGLDLRAVSSPYNTYAQPGLPVGPIANPGLASLEAAVHPSETGFYYYRALCDGSGRHAFAETYEQHLANACP